MTRETKIGLLVGLAFIIVIGILLSDHLSTSVEPPQARLAQAGDTVRSGTITPGHQPAPPVTLVTPQSHLPVQPVPVTQELVQRQPPVQFVQPAPGQTTQTTPRQPQPMQPQPMQPQPTVIIGGPSTQQPQALTQPSYLPQVPYPMPPAQPTQQRLQPAPRPQPAPTTLEHVAQQHNEAIVPLGTPSQPQAAATRTTAPQPQPSATVQGMEYRAEPGDTLNKLAGRFMGGNTQANRDAILRANPSLQNDPDKIIAGRTYIIPVAQPVQAQAQASTAQPQQTAAAPVPAPAPAPAAMRQPASQESWYTAKEGDSLWRIAAEQLGDGNAYNAIKELNREVLRGSDVIQPGMRLRLPPRSVASAAD